MNKAFPELSCHKRLGYAMTVEDLMPIMRDSDVNLTGQMNHREYLMCDFACNVEQDRRSNTAC